MLSRTDIVASIVDGQVIESLDMVAQTANEKAGFTVLSDSNINKIAKNVTKMVLNDLAVLAQSELAAGEDFTVPGVARVSWRYRAPQAKGARWSKGQTVVGFGGIESVKDSDSPVVKAKVTLKASPVAAAKKHAPKATDQADQKKFLSSKTGKYIAGRKTKS